MSKNVDSYSKEVTKNIIKIFKKFNKSYECIEYLLNDTQIYNSYLNNVQFIWEKISLSIPKDYPFELCYEIYKYLNKLNKDHIPLATWVPDGKYNSNIEKFMNNCGYECYSKFHEWSYKYYEQFWQKAIDAVNIQFEKKYKSICDIKNIESPNWLPGAKLNIVDSCFVSKKKTAIVWQYEGEKKINSISYLELENLVDSIAWSIDALNLKKGSRFVIYMPMSLEAIAIYLAIIKSGNIVVSIADSFAADELKTRVDISNANLIFTQDFVLRNNKFLPLYNKIIESNSPIAIVIKSDINSGINIDLRKGDIAWQEFLISDSKGKYSSISCNPHDYINILFSSGTTGDPKAIPWDHTTAIKSAVDGYLHIDICDKDIVNWPTNLGWMMGPWLIFATLINKATISLYCGAPQTKEFAKFINESNTSILGVIPSLVSSWKNNRVLDDISWSNIKLFASTGEASNVEDMFWLSHSGCFKPIIEYCGGTEIGGAYITSTLLNPNVPALFNSPALGMNFVILDDEGKICDKGEVAIIPPSIGLSRELLNKEHHIEYYEDMPRLDGDIVLRRHGDAIERLEHGYYRTLGRVDDTMNLGGIKVSAVEIEKVVYDSEEILECAAVSSRNKNNNTDKLILYIVPVQKKIEFYKNKVNLKLLQDVMQNKIKNKLNPLFKIDKVVVLDSIPRTASNKIIRRLLKK